MCYGLLLRVAFLLRRPLLRAPAPVPPAHRVVDDRAPAPADVPPKEESNSELERIFV